MNYSDKKSCVILWILAVAVFLCGSAAAADQPLTADNQIQGTASPNSPASNTTADDGWHIAAAPYLWFPGLNGTIGAFGHNVGVNLSPGEVLSHFHIGLMGAVELRKNRFVMPVDFIWVKLQADHGLPFESGLTSAQVKVTQIIFTPKVGYRIVDKDKVKVDALAGIRYWHLGQNFSFQPSGILSNFSPSVNWVDGLGGAKLEATLSPKILMTIFGDAGGGGADLDYQVGGLLGFKLKKAILQAGYRYLDTNYRSGSPNFFVYNVHEGGAVLGVIFNLK